MLQPNGCKVAINWSTAQEVNNDYFLVERSNDGRIFHDYRSKVSGAGNSTELHSSTVQPMDIL